MLTLFSRKKAGDSSKSPLLIRFMELRCLNTLRIQNSAEFLELLLVSNGQMNIGRVVVVRTTKLVSMFNASMGCLNCLLGDRNVAPRYSIQIRFRLSALHTSPILLVTPFLQQRWRLPKHYCGFSIKQIIYTTDSKSDSTTSLVI